MRDRIAIIGWGSLLWDLENLTPHVEGDWRLTEGPALPLEFSRISPKRKLGLVVCIDPEHGVPCATHAILSVRADLDAARQDLARRERAPLPLIGLWCARTGRAEGRGAPFVADWAAAQGLAGAVWTDLEPNFAAHRGEPFALDRAVDYLAGLTGESLEEAVRYIVNAPRWTDTPLRRRLAALDWWRAEAARLSPRPPEAAPGPASAAPPRPPRSSPPSPR